MEFAITKEQRHFFESTGAVELEGCLSEKDRLILNESLKEALKNRLKVTDKGLQAMGPSKLFLQGRNLSLESKPLSRILFKRPLASIASELTQTRILRYGLDQFFPGSELHRLRSPLEASFCIQGLQMVLLVCLSGEGQKSAALGVDELVQSPFTSIPGNVVFISKSYQFHPDALREAHLQNSTYLMLGYSGLKTVYVLKEADELSHYLKKFGYSFGDKLSDEEYPILIR